MRKLPAFLCVGVISSAALLLGCNQAALMSRLAPQHQVSEAENYVSLLRQQKFDQIGANLDPGVTAADTRQQLEAMASLFPAGDPISIKTVGFNTFQQTTYSRVSVTLEYQFPHDWLLANLTTEERDGVTRITGFHAERLADSLENLNRFTLAHKSTLQYTVLLLAVLDLGFTLYILVLCIRTKGLKLKWLWLIAILIGIGRYGINWTTGHEFFNLIFLNLPTVGAGATEFGPWLVYFSFPLPAFIFWLRRESLGHPTQAPTNSPLEQIEPQQLQPPESQTQAP